MHTFPGPSCARLGRGALLVCLAVAAGCPAVREDRTITWSGSGDRVGFQHGRDGVFVADREGGGLTKVFQPGADVLATSPPLWHPAGGRLIFTTARPAQANPAPPLPFTGDPDPAGRVFLQQPVVYTCWLREEAHDGPAPQPQPLFDAACDNVGYVAANLAVRWHPHGDRILYVKEVSAGRHGVFEYDLAAGTSRQVFPHTAEALVFDWAPDGEHLVCLLNSAHRDPTADGIWVGRPGAADWWHVPDSGALAEGQLPSLLEQLRATRPAWTRGGSRFAFVSSLPAQTADRPVWHFLCLGTLATHEVTVAAAAGEPFRDLHWSPDGGRLGVVQGETGSLRLLEEGGELSGPVNRRPVRQFAGWRGDGKRLAYVVPDPVGPAGGEAWAFLLVPEPLARDAVYLADGRGTEPGHEVLSGMRVTFPNWAPAGDRLSLWVTFSPPYRSPLAEMLRYLNLGLHRGDPAAVLDTVTGRLSWMAVDADEKTQVGHYYLLKHEYAEAWRWYEQAERDQPPAQPELPAADVAHLEEALGTRDPALFEYHCLTKLGRDEEAREKLARFRRTYLRLPDKEHQPLLGQRLGDREVGEWLRGLFDPETLSGALLRDLYAAEVFLSVDAAADGEAFLRREMDAAPSDPARLGSALALAQLLLVQQKHRAYADLATETIAPLLFRAERGASLGNGLTPQSVQELAAVYVGGYTLLPLFAPDFVAGLPDDQLRALAPRWQALHAAAQDDFSRLAADLVLEAVYQRLGMEKERQAVAGRLAAERAAAGSVPWSGDLAGMIRQVRKDGVIPLPAR